MVIHKTIMEQKGIENGYTERELKTGIRKLTVCTNSGVPRLPSKKTFYSKKFVIYVLLNTINSCIRNVNCLFLTRFDWF